MDGAEKQKLINYSRKIILKILPFSKASKREISLYLDLSDIALVNLKKSDEFKNVIPSKIFENVLFTIPFCWVFKVNQNL